MARGQVILILAALVLLSGGVPLAPGGGPDAAAITLAHAADLDLSPTELPAGTVSNGAEPDIHVARSGTVILVGDVSGLYRSLNGGATWSKAPDPFLPGVFADGWAIAEDDVGRIYVATTQGQVTGVASSANRGQTWDIVSEVVAVAGIADRPWLAARGDGEVALVIYGTRGEECYHSVDKGATWLDRSVHSSGSPNAGSLEYDSKGRTWYSNGNAWYRWPNSCLGTPSALDHPNAGPQILTQTALDASDRPYTAVPSANNGQMLVHSLNPGTGVKTVAVSLPAQKSNTFGAIDVEKATGDVIVSWYGSTTAGNPSSSTFGGSWHVFVARIEGFWTASPTVTVQQVTPAATPNHVGAFCMSGVACSGGADRDLLDYHGVDVAPDGSIHIAYGHDGSGTSSQVRHARIVL